MLNRNNSGNLNQSLSSLGLGFVLNLASKAINSNRLIRGPIRGPIRRPTFDRSRIQNSLFCGFGRYFLKILNVSYVIVKQKLSILVLPKWQKIDSDSKVPVYLRIIIDGLRDEISIGCKVCQKHWNEEFKRVESGTPGWQGINKKINNAVTDIERHFNLMVAKHAWQLL